MHVTAMPMLLSYNLSRDVSMKNSIEYIKILQMMEVYKENSAVQMKMKEKRERKREEDQGALVGRKNV